LKAGQFMLGIDENTALVGRLDGEWKVMGTGRVHRISRSSERLYEAGQLVPMQPDESRD
jgi:hypothetical protein